MITLFIISIILDRAARTNVAWSTRGAAFSVEIFFLWKATYLPANAQQTRETRWNKTKKQKRVAVDAGVAASDLGTRFCRGNRDN